jgi:DNA-binding transcriptional LysR family regulator
MIPFSLQQLRILKAVANEKSFTKAAEVLYLSQPSLSKQIKNLEKSLDTLLIHRENNKISLTENGKVFLQYSERILALCEESCRALIDLKNGERGDLVIGATQSIGTYLLPKVLALFSQNYPQIDLTVKIHSTRVIAKNIINQDVDVGVVGGEIPFALKENLKVEEFVQDEFSLIVPTSHPFATRKKISKEDLYHLNFITLHSKSSIRHFVDEILLQNQVETKRLKTVVQLSSIEGIKTAVSLGLGAAFVSSSAVKKEMELNTIKILKIENLKVNRTLTLVTNPDSQKSKAFDFFYNQLATLKKHVEN